MTPNNCPALVLNYDFSPMSIFPLPLLGWQDAITGVLLDRFVVVAEYDQVARSPGPIGGVPKTMRLPSVLAQKTYQRRDRPVPFTRAGVLLRAKGKCAYCSSKLSMRDLTFDHVIPQSSGGLTTWKNVVASCSPCNSIKANKPLGQCGLVLRHLPYVPTRFQMDEMARDNFPVPMSRIHPTWMDYLRIKQPTGKQPDVLVDQSSVFPAGMTAEHYWNVEIDAS